MICVFDIIEGPARGKRFWMRQDQKMEIGRISTADFSIPADHHMSRHHMIIEATVSSFRVRDVGSANGTFVNNSKITALELCSGDRIRAGSSTFEVSLIPDGESPHARDGLALDSEATNSKSSFESSSSVGVAQVSPQLATRQKVARQIISLDADEEKTKRLYSNGVANPVLRSEKSNSTGGPMVSRVDRRVTALQSATWWLEYFVPTNVPHVFHEAVDFDRYELDLAGLLQNLDDEFRISAVLNVEKLSRFELDVIAEWRQLSRVLELSPELCLLSSDGSTGFWTLVRNSVRRDAIIVFGSHAPVSNAWLRQSCDLLRSPTTFSDLVMNSTDHLREDCLAECEFVIFEQNSSGKLAILKSAD